MIERIEGENLFSWEKLDYSVTGKLSQISGYNADDATYEGSGKSSVINIATWTIWGKIPKANSPGIDECVREGAKNAFGRVTLSSGEVIERRRGKDQGLFVDGRKSTQDEVDGLTMSFDLFCQTIYFAQDYPRRFILADEETKAKVLTEARDLSVYDKARKAAEDEYKKLKGECDAGEVYLKDYRERVREAEGEAAWVEKELGVFEENRLESIRKITEDIDSYTGKLDLRDVEPIDAEVAALEEQEKELIAEASRVESRKRLRLSALNANATVEAQVKELKRRYYEKRHEAEHLEPDKCPTCAQSVDEGTVKSHSEKLMKEGESFLDQARELKKKLQDVPEEVTDDERSSAANALNKVRTALNLTRNSATAARVHNRSVADAQKTVAALKDRRKQEKMRSPDSLLEKQAACAAKLEKARQVLADYEAKHLASVALRDQYDDLRKHFKQIKSDIFLTALAELTRNANAFLQELFATPVRIKFENVVERNVTKIKTLVTINGRERSLGLYSGGQYGRIAIAVDLALSKMVSGRSTKPFNLRFLDEPMKNLSPESKLRVMSLLEKLPGRTVLIEHDKEVQAMVHSNFRIEFKNGVSRRAT